MPRPFFCEGIRCVSCLVPPKTGLRHSACLTSTVGSAEAGSFGPRPAQSVFCDVHAAAKNGLDLFRAVRGANSVRQ